MANIEERVKVIVAEQLQLDKADINAGARFVKDLGADSLDVMEMAMAIEEEFECEISDEEVEKLLTMEQVVEYLKMHAK